MKKRRLTRPNYTDLRQHIAIEGIQIGIVNVGDENALAQIVEHDASREGMMASGSAGIVLGWYRRIAWPHLLHSRHRRAGMRTSR